VWAANGNDGAGADVGLHRGGRANNTKHQSVIFSDNDYEIFISPDGSNHYYKEFEMNARGTWWDLVRK